MWLIKPLMQSTVCWNRFVRDSPQQARRQAQNFSYMAVCALCKRRLCLLTSRGYKYCLVAGSTVSFPLRCCASLSLLINCCAQYDLSTSTFSPDGRVFQTDYAQKAVDNSGCASPSTVTSAFL